MEGEEAEAALMELDGTQKLRAHTAGAAAEEEEQEEFALASAAHISLADNGVELRIGRRIIGAREFSRYYRQHHRPSESRTVTVAAENTRRVFLVALVLLAAR